MPEVSFDVCVIGGGPAGSATATRLAKLGHSVCVVESSVFPRPHVGESLTPGIRPIFDVLGFVEPTRNGFSNSGETLVRWSETNVEHIVPSRRAGGLLVDRGRFDTLLLQGATRNGVRVFQPARVTKVGSDDLGWRIQVTANGSSHSVTAKFLVDAAGRKGFLQRNRKTVSPRTLALCGYLTSEECPTVTLVEATPYGWCWGAPIPGGLFSTMVFLDRDTVQAQRREGLEFVWRSHLAKAELFSVISRLKLIGRLVVCDATTYFAEDPIDGNIIRVGEASFALDPLSSTGVEKAMQSGLIAATTLHTILTRSDRKELCARFYRERQKETVLLHASWSSEFYGKVRRYADLPFWRERMRVSPHSRVEQGPVAATWGEASPTLTSKVKISANAELAEEACILGDEICSRPALSHPSLGRPVAFVEGVEVGLLLDMVQRSTDLGRLLALWSSRISPIQAIRVAAWFFSKKILEIENGRGVERVR